MLTIRPNCENCDKDLLYNSTQAMICSYECTFCQECVDTILKNVCPNCGGGFTSRPIRPKDKLAKHPASNERVLKPIDSAEHQKLLARYEHVLPENR